MTEVDESSHGGFFIVDEEFATTAATGWTFAFGQARETIGTEICVIAGKDHGVTLVFVAEYTETFFFVVVRGR